MNKRIRTGVIAAAVAGGSILGLGQIGTVSAQVDDEPDAPDTDEPADAPEGEGEGERPGRRGDRGAKFQAIADVLGMETDAVREALRGGSTLADIAAEQGVSVDAVVDVIVDAKTERIQGAVDDGRITQEQADERLADLDERVTTRVNEGRPERGEGDGFRGPRGPRGPQGGGAPADAPADA